MKEKELMAAILRILLQKGTINEDVFDNSIKKIKETWIFKKKIHTFENIWKSVSSQRRLGTFFRLGEEKFYIDKKQDSHNRFCLYR